jgi:hypothetical protein
MRAASAIGVADPGLHAVSFRGTKNADGRDKRGDDRKI